MGRNVRYADQPRMIPAWAATVRLCLENGVIVDAVCGSCNLFRPAQLEAIQAKFGNDYNLFDKKPRCPQCGKLGHFMYSVAPGTPKRPMRTER
jgi:hypothetical protein